MSGEWIKIECSAPDKPEVVKIARILKKPRGHVFGCLVIVWAWFDRNSVDGVVDGVVSTDLDELAGMKGLASAMSAVSWLFCDDDKQRLELPNFSRHNGVSAKKRALNSERQRRWRVTDVDAQALQDRLPEKRRVQDISTPPTPLPGGRAEKVRQNGKGTPGWWETTDATLAEAQRLKLSTRGQDWTQLKTSVRKALAAQKHSAAPTHAREQVPAAATHPALDPDQGFPLKAKSKFEDTEPEEQQHENRPFGT